MNSFNEHIENEHLTAYQMSVAADALMDNQYDGLEQEISDHIDVCSKCKAEILMLVEVLGQMDNGAVGAIEEPKPIEKVEPAQAHWPKWLAAASIALLAVISVINWQNSNTYKSELVALQNDLDKANESNVSNMVDSFSLKTRSQTPSLESITEAYSDSLNKLSSEFDSASSLLAVAYKENQLFEEQIGMTLRSASMVVETPQYFEQPYGKAVVLSWKIENSEPMGVAVYNNKGTLIQKGSEAKDQFLLDSELLLPGIYYWKLIGGEGVVFIGKISLH